MNAAVHDRLVVPGAHVDDRGRVGDIVEVRGPDGGPPYVVRWEGSEATSLVFPGPDALLRHPAADD
jgi:hypothetical protein